MLISLAMNIIGNGVFSTYCYYRESREKHCIQRTMETHYPKCTAYANQNDVLRIFLDCGQCGLSRAQYLLLLY